MRLVCIDNNGVWVDEEFYYKRTDKDIKEWDPYAKLVLNEEYEARLYKIDSVNLVLRDYQGYIIIIEGEPLYFNSKRFESVNDSRERKLNKLFKI